MDLYLSPQDTLSLQEMLDCDYKTDFDSVLAGADLGLSLSGDLPPLELDDALGGTGDMTMWFSNGLHSGNSNSSNSNFNLDLGGDAAAMMVNPSSVMPVTLVTVPSSTSSNNVFITSSSLSPTDEEDVVSFSSAVKSAPSSSAGSIASYVRTISTTTASRAHSPQAQRQQAGRPPTSTTIRIAAATSTSQHSTSSSNGLPTLLTSKTVPLITSSTKLSQPKQLAHVQVSNQNHVRTLHIQQSQTHTKKQHSLNNNNKHFVDLDYDEKPYPKPAYSYSCLIAMALKNSKTGSLPVSEIYNFMCEHFPYFKTAPNGWKNSVRHNLSLNKCFEKIEKPTGSGSQQRKGCLWAMNPAKIVKMDEEVQKWSKKDPMAIKKAMVCPDNLEMLERGEMKREFSGLSSISSGVGGSVSGGEDSDVDDGAGSEPCTPLTPRSSHVLPEFIDINNIALTGGDSFDESSLTDFDLEVAEGIYEELDAEDEKLNLGVTLTAASQAELLSSSTTVTLPLVTSTSRVQGDYAPASKRSRLGTSTFQGNYVYKPMVAVSPSSGGSSRRKAPILLRASASASSLIKLEDP